VVSGDGTVRVHFLTIENDAEEATGLLTVELSGADAKAVGPVRFRVTGSASGSRRWFGLLVPRSPQRP
jgi:hypothetical protein